MNRAIRKQRRHGSGDGDTLEVANPHSERYNVDDPRNRQRGAHPSNRRDNNGWQPINHQEHADQFINRITGAKFGQPKYSPNEGGVRLIPGKGVPKREQGRPVGSQNPSGNRHLEHQPALANVVSKQQQGVGAYGKASMASGLDAFTMGDIRQADKFLENGRMGLDEYARKVASGEISTDFQSESNFTGGFFAEEDERATRPWMDSNFGAGRVVRGSAMQRGPMAPPPPPPSFAAPKATMDSARAQSVAAQQAGTQSNASGLALLQMLIDRKSPAPSATRPGTSGGQGPRQLTQQQINELISMSKRTGPKAPTVSPPVNTSLQQGVNNLTKRTAAAPHPQSSTGNLRPQIVPGQQSRATQQISAPGSAPAQTPPHVAALLEQLHRQQLAQQQTTGDQPAGNAPPQECQQQ